MPGPGPRRPRPRRPLRPLRRAAREKCTAVTRKFFAPARPSIFGDLIVEAYKLLRDHPEVLEKVPGAFPVPDGGTSTRTRTRRAVPAHQSSRAEVPESLRGGGTRTRASTSGAARTSRTSSISRRTIRTARDPQAGAELPLHPDDHQKGASAVIRNNKGPIRQDPNGTANDTGEKIKWAQLPDERGRGRLRGPRAFPLAEQETATRSYQDIAVFFTVPTPSRGPLEETFRRPEGSLPDRGRRGASTSAARDQGTRSLTSACS